jgi:hypothetical protein
MFPEEDAKLAVSCQNAMSLEKQFIMSLSLNMTLGLTDLPKI